jgi:hypothetical protein
MTTAREKAVKYVARYSELGTDVYRLELGGEEIRATFYGPGHVGEALAYARWKNSRVFPQKRRRKEDASEKTQVQF